MLRRIVDVQPRPGQRLWLRYDDCSEVTVDLAGTIATVGVFAPLADEQFFRRVSLGEGGRCLEWPGEIDLCADALWLAGTRQDRAALSGAAADPAGG